MRYLRLQHWLNETKPDLVVYEEVRAHKGATAAQVYGGIIGVIGAFCESRDIPYTAIPVGTIKKHATGKGNSNKAAMIDAAKAKWGDTVTAHDQADALWILDCHLAMMSDPSAA